MTNFDLYWARLTRVLSFATGLAIMVYETIGDHSDRPWLYAAAVGMMGLPIARAAEAVLTRIGSVESGPHQIPGGEGATKVDVPKSTGGSP